jgi:macrolide-specific efflux system membrane fusion protein
VARIVPQRVAGENRPLYYVYLTPDFVPQTILPGMTADAAIIIAQADDVLRLPRAIVRAGSSNTASLRLWQNGQEVSREVEVGLRGDIYIEIVDGVREGDEVVGE